MPSVHSQHKGNHKGGGVGPRPPPFVEAAEGRPPLRWRPKAATFQLALNKAYALALNTAHVMRLNKADVLALNKAHVLRLNNTICPVFTASTKETTEGGRPKAAGPLVEAAEGRLLCVGCEHWAYLTVET